MEGKSQGQGHARVSCYGGVKVLDGCGVVAIMCMGTVGKVVKCQVRLVARSGAVLGQSVSVQCSPSTRVGENRRDSACMRTHRVHSVSGSERPL